MYDVKNQTSSSCSHCQKRRKSDIIKTMKSFLSAKIFWIILIVLLLVGFLIFLGFSTDNLPGPSVETTPQFRNPIGPPQIKGPTGPPPAM